MFNTATPADGASGSVLFGQIFENDKLNRALNDAAVLITGLTRGKIVAWSATSSRWELYDGTVAPEATTTLGIVEYVGSPDTSGGVRVTGVYLDDTLTDNTAYYCQSNGTLGTTETATYIGVCTDAGRLVMQGRGSGSGGGGASIGTGNYIAEPFAVTAGTGLEVSVAANRCVIDETVCESTTATTVALTAKAAQLIYKKKDNTYDKLLPAMTAADLVDANTVGLWFPDGSASVPNAAVGVNGNTLAVANALTKSGTVTAVDGWAGGDAAKGDGSTGYYQSANTAGFPTGANRAIGVFFVAGASSQYTLGHYGTSTGYTFELLVQSGNLKVSDFSTIWDTGYALTAGAPYHVELQYDGARITVVVNGHQVYSIAQVLNNVTLTNLNVFRRADNSFYSNATIIFIEILNLPRTKQQSAALAQKLLIPCAYGTTDIRDAFANKAESQAVAFVIASATVPTTIIAPNDPKGATPDWAYGMRIGPNGVLNKTKRLGRKSFSGTSTPEWDNPFGSRNMTIDAEWSLDASGTNSSQIPNDAANSYPSILANGKIRETITTGVNVAGVNKTSGYIDAICEVID